jgi:hypothetical protein
MMRRSRMIFNMNREIFLTSFFMEIKTLSLFYSESEN